MHLKSPRRMLALYALLFGVGIFVGVRLENGGVWLMLSALSAAIGIAFLRMGRAVWIAIAVSVFFAGAALSSFAAHPALPPEGEYHITATVREEATVRETDGRVKTTLKNAVLTDESGASYRLKGLYWTYWPEAADEPLPVEGQTAEFDGKIYHPAGKTNPYGFDFKLYLLQNGMQAGVTGGEGLVLSPHGQTKPKSMILRLRAAIIDKLRTLLQEDAALAEALLLGETEGMPEEIRAGFRKAGVAHVLSVSGLHAMLIMSLVVMLLERFSPSPRVMLCLSGVLLAFYGALVGMNAPMIRAAVLVLYQLLGRCVRRHADPLTGLSAGFITVLIIHPLDLFSAGFQMSFGAVLGMIMLGDRVRGFLARIRNKTLRGICTAYGVTLSATLGTALPMIYCFNRLSLIGVVVNPLICALIELLLPAFIVLLLISLISMPLALGAAPILSFLSRLATQGVQRLGEMPYAGITLPDPPWYLAAAIVLCLLLCTRYVDLSLKKRLITGAAALTASVVLMLALQDHSVRYVQLDVGNASAAVIEDGAQTIVIDAGEYGGDVASYLLSTGRRADYLFLTHLHTDHALGLEQLLADEVKIGCIFLPDEAEAGGISENIAALLVRAQEMGIPVQRVGAGDELASERVHIEVLWPKTDMVRAIADVNDTSLALYIDLDGVTLLHMSDVSDVYELYAARPADILLCGHHGSAASTGETFLSRVQPTVALIGGDDPSEKTLKRLVNAGTMVYDTGTRGALTVRVRKEAYFVRGYLQ